MDTAVNTLATFLAGPVTARIEPKGISPAVPTPTAPPHAIVLCGSAVLDVVAFAAGQYHAAQASWRASGTPDVAVRLFITGGVGHSTHLLHEAVQGDPKIAAAVEPDPAVDAHVTMLVQPAQGSSQEAESVVTARLLAKLHGVPLAAMAVEAASTNCGHNAELVVPHVLSWANQPNSSNDGEGFRVLLVQEPTMLRRSHHSFELHFQRQLGIQSPAAAAVVVGSESEVDNVPPQARRALHCVCAVVLHSATLPPFLLPHPTASDRTLPWTVPRYLGLLLGEVPRLTDGPGGYGPLGRGFITTCDIPAAVCEAHETLHSHVVTSAQR